MKTVILATFKGADRSLGFRTGRSYTLTVESLPDGQVDIKHENLLKAPNGEGIGCVYRTIITFFDNWDSINTSPNSQLT